LDRRLERRICARKELKNRDEYNRMKRRRTRIAHEVVEMMMRDEVKKEEGTVEGKGRTD
jgi:uncharacterized protein with ATP-grasp and redox domains